MSTVSFKNKVTQTLFSHSLHREAHFLVFFDLSCSCSSPPSTETADTSRHPSALRECVITVLEWECVTKGKTLNLPQTQCD